MRRFLAILAAIALVAIVLGSSHSVRAQEATPQASPSTDPHTYDDPAMHFEAPKEYFLVERRVISPDDLGDPQIVAMWVKNPGRQDLRTLTISVEQYNGNVDQYETSVENDVRAKIDGAIIANKTRTTTPNGMPAYFMSITSGSGFDGQKQFELVWSDGLRGVSIVVAGRLGDLKEAEARTAVGNVSAVRYPIGRL
ncbi:MAG TPA: hypothetical protein VMS32_10230 [Verrucomicrobiae bacterium]|jgi:hypothetical protein|nr:hypothetical protein [Verrucomicrobiae bacterium]